MTTYQEYHGEGPLTDSGTCTYMGLPCEAILNFDYYSYPGSGGWGDSSPWEVCATNVYGYYDGKSCDNMADSGILAGVACSLTCAKMPSSPYWQYHRECMGALAVEEQCTNCGADTFSTVIGATSSTTCVTCPAFSTCPLPRRRAFATQATLVIAQHVHYASLVRTRMRPAAPHALFVLPASTESPRLLFLQVFLVIISSFAMNKCKALKSCTFRTKIGKYCC